MEGYCSRCTGIVILIVGVLLLVNVYLVHWDMGLVVSWLVALAGLSLIAWPTCGCGQGCRAPPLEMKKKK
jgi:hypothetical protein